MVGMTLQPAFIWFRTAVTKWWQWETGGGGAWGLEMELRVFQLAPECSPGKGLG